MQEEEPSESSPLKVNVNIGSKPIEKLIGLVEKGAAGIFSKGYARRRKLEIDARAYEIREIAKANYYAEKLANGEVPLDEFLPAIPAGSKQIFADKTEPTIQLEDIAASITEAKIAETIRHDANVTHAIMNADRLLSEDDSATVAEDIDEDWFIRWRESAGNVSQEQLQEVWGKLLAGEIKNPGTFSLRTLDTIRNLTREDAEIISKLKPFAAHRVIFKNAYENSPNALSYDARLDLQDLGILSGVDAFGLNMQYSSLNPTQYFQALSFGNKNILMIQSQDSSKVLTLDAFKLTRVGFEILQVSSNYSVDTEYVNELAKEIRDKGFSVDVVEIKGNLAEVTNSYAPPL